MNSRSIQALKEMEVILGQKAAQLYDRVGYDEAIIQAQTTMSMVTDDATRLLSGYGDLSRLKISPDLLKAKPTIEKLLKLRQRLNNKNFDLAVTTYEEIFRCPTSHLVYGAGVIDVFIHIPAYHRGTRMKLLEYVPVPYLIEHDMSEEVITAKQQQQGPEDPLSMVAMPEETYVAVTDDGLKFKTYTKGEFVDCQNYEGTYFCPQNNIYNHRKKDSCLIGLFLKKTDIVEEMCTWRVKNAEDYALQLSGNSFLLYQRNVEEISLHCGEDSIHMPYQGLKQIEVPPGCTLFSPHYQLDGQEEFSVATEAYEAHEINFTDILDNMDIGTTSGELIRGLKRLEVVGSMEGIKTRKLRDRYQTYTHSDGWNTATKGLILSLTFGIPLMIFLCYCVWYCHPLVPGEHEEASRWEIINYLKGRRHLLPPQHDGRRMTTYHPALQERELTDHLMSPEAFEAPQEAERFKTFMTQHRQAHDSTSATSLVPTTTALTTTTPSAPPRSGRHPSSQSLHTVSFAGGDTIINASSDGSNIYSSMGPPASLAEAKDTLARYKKTPKIPSALKKTTTPATTTQTTTVDVHTLAHETPVELQERAAREAEADSHHSF